MNNWKVNHELMNSSNSVFIMNNADSTVIKGAGQTIEIWYFC